MRRVAQTALLVVALAVAAYWFWSPYLVIRQIQAAAQNGDAQAFNDRVDYPRLRDSLKMQMSSLVADKLGRPDPGNPLTALGGVLGLAVVDTVVDAIVRPDVMMLGLRSGKFAPPSRQAEARPGALPQPQPLAPEWAYERMGLNKLVAYQSRAGVADETGVGIVFERSGFANWKLTDVRLPAAKP